MQTENTSARWGAYQHEWENWQALGFTRDLLPVVSDPNARIAPYSKMKALGKTPSRYSERDMVSGIPRWTERQTTAQHVDNWKREPNYGICVQTRRLRALDIDIDDPETAERVARLFTDAVSLSAGVEPAVRWRANSGKRLLAFVLEGSADRPYTKRIMRTEGGIVEFLADGQQFVAHGTHPSGARYEWTGIPDPLLGDEVCVLDPDAFEAAWTLLVQTFAHGDVVETVPARGLRERRLPPTEPDPVALFMDEGGWVLSQQRDGRLNITCPFEDQHTSESNETATQYFPAGTGGYVQGHFRCLHAHCAHRTDGDFLNEIGYVAAQFGTIGDAPAGGAGEVVVTEPQGDEAWPVMSRNAQGRIFATIGNVVRACGAPAFIGFEIRHDTFRDEIMLREAHDDALAWRAFTDADYTSLRLSMERRGFMPVGRELVRDAVLAVANLHRFDSAQAWLTGLPLWDGVPRVRRFFNTYARADGQANEPGYVEAVGAYLWTALAGRVMTPGCQVDMVPILVGAQGAGKTSLVREIAPAPDFFMEAALDAHDAELSRRMRGTLVAEIGELRGLRSRDLEAIKSFITRTHEQWVPKYREFATVFPRRLVFIGTTNEDSFLADDTGDRRWLPVRVGTVDREALVRDRDQLWAEGLELWRKGGVAWAEAHATADAAREAHSVTDEWSPAVVRWAFDDALGVAPALAEEGFTVAEALVGALGFDLKKVTRADEMRAASVLRRAGLERRRVQKGRARHWRWALAKNAECSLT